MDIIDASYPTMKESNILRLGNPKRRKVRDIYDIGDGNICLVTTDRISTHDVVYRQCIPHKGYILTQTSVKAFELLENKGIHTHFIFCPDPNTMIVKKAELFPVEAVVRGIITGSAWRSYQATGEVCGIKLPKGLKKNQMLDEPIFTPATKAEHGLHDENISFERLCELIGTDKAEYLRKRSIDAYKVGFEEAKKHGGLLADTKFEWGDDDGDIIIVDEAFTHDSSRYVEMQDWEQAMEEGRDPKWVDKQVVRDYAEGQGFHGEGDAPALPEDIVRADIAACAGAFTMLTGKGIGPPEEPPSDSRIENNLIKYGFLKRLID